MADSSHRTPSIRSFAVHPFFPMLMVPLANPFMGWVWMTVNAMGIRGPSRAVEVLAIGAAAVGAIVTLSCAEVLVESNAISEGLNAWVQLGAYTWLLALSLVAFAFQKHRWELVAPYEHIASMSHAPARWGNPPTIPAERAAFAVELLRQGWILDAEIHARVAVRLDADNVAGHQVLAQSLLAHGRYDEAAVALDFALARVDDLDLSAMYAAALSGQGRAEDALEVLIQARILWPEDRGLALQQAETLSLLGHYKEAENAARDCAAGDPYDADAHALVADLMLRQGRLDEVKIPARSALRTDPDQYMARNAIGGARALQTFLLDNWWIHNDWLLRNGKGWSSLPYLLGFVLYELTPLVDHPGPRRLGIFLFVGYAIFSVWGLFSYHSNLEDALEDAGL